MSGIILSVDSVEQSTTPSQTPLINVFGRDKDGNAHHIKIHGFEPYCYIPEQIALDKQIWCDYRITKVEDKPYTAIRGESDRARRMRKVYTRLPGDLELLKESYGAWEADVRYPIRFLVDKDIRGGIWVPGEECHVSEIKPATAPHPCRICIADIECEDERGFPKPERDAINCLTVWDSFADCYTVFYLANGRGNDDLATIQKGWAEDRDDIEIRRYTNERDLLLDLITYIDLTNPDILAGWNFIFFDMPYIVERLIHLGIDPMQLCRIPGNMTKKHNRLPGRAVFDLRDGYKRLETNEKESYRLDAIAEDELGEHKIHYTGTLCDLWRNDPGTFVKYNWKDVELSVRIEQKKAIVDFHREIGRFIGCPLATTLNNSQIADVLVLRRASEKFVLPNRGQNETTDGFKGAVVLDPSTGLRSNVLAFDLNSLYPMTMVTLNASYETKVLSCQTFQDDQVYTAPNGVRFWNTFTGMTKEMMLELLEERKVKKTARDTHPYGSPEYKLFDLQQRVVKEIMNSYYGVSGFPIFRLFDPEIGAAVTSTGRALLQFTKEEIESITAADLEFDAVIEDLEGIGFEVIYGDTDSCLAQFPEHLTTDETITIGFALATYLNTRYDAFAATLGVTNGHRFNIKFEKIYERFLQAGKKKRYAGKLKWKEGVPADEVDISGFESERSDTPAITKEVQKTMLEMLINGSTKAEVISYIRENLRRYMKQEFTLDQIGIPGGIQKELSEYEKPDAHIRGAIYANRHLGKNFGKASKPKRVYISYTKDTYPQTDVLSFEYGADVPDSFVVDIDAMQKKGFQEPLKRVTDALGWNWNEIDPTRTTLAMYGVD